MYPKINISFHCHMGQSVCTSLLWIFNGCNPAVHHTLRHFVSLSQWRELSNGGTQALHMQRKAWLQSHLKHFCGDPLHPCRIKIFEDLNKNISYLFFQLWCHKLERSIFLEKNLTSFYTENCSGNLFRMAASEAELKKFRLRFHFELTTKEYILSCYFAAT